MLFHLLIVTIYFYQLAICFFMKKNFLIALFFLSGYVYAFSQSQYEVLPDKEENGKIFKGIISRQVLQNEPSFTWYAENLKGYTPNASAVTELKKNKDSVELLVFMGTWCHDSQYIIPKFFSLIDACGFSNDRVTLIGTDRDKKTLSHLAEALNVLNVPTIMVMKNGKELGRVVEYGKYGLFDKEIGEILANADKASN